MPRTLALILATVATLSPLASQDIGRPVWKPPARALFWGDVSPDGRYIAFADGGDLNVYVRDLQTGTTRAVTSRPPAPSDTGVPGDDVWAFSGDSRRLAFSWAKDGREELRVGSIAGGDVRTIYSAPDVRWITAWAWSPDGKSIATGIWRTGKQESELGLLDVGSGQFTLLARVRGPATNNQGRVSFSPDGRWLAYWPREAGKQSRDLLLLPVAGGEPRRVESGEPQDELLGWAPDGRELLILTVRGEERSLRAVNVGETIASGAPGTTRVLRAVAGSFDVLGMAVTGAVYVRTSPQPRWRGAIAQLEFSSGRVIERARELSVAGAQLQPDSWSHDGRYLALRSTLGDEEAEHFAVIYDAATGSLRVLKPDLPVYGRLILSADGKYAALRGARAQTMASCCGAFIVDTATGTVREIAAKVGRVLAWTTDDRIFFDSSDVPADTTTLFEFDVARGTSRAVYQWRDLAGARHVGDLSDDGRLWFFRAPASAASTTHNLHVTDVSTGQSRTLWSDVSTGSVSAAANGRFVLTSRNGETVLLRVSDGAVLPVPKAGNRIPEVLAWSEDGRAFLGRTRETADQVTYWWIPMDDNRQPRKLDAGIGASAAGFVIHGNRVAFGERLPAAAGPGDEVRVIDGLFPKRGGVR